MSFRVESCEAFFTSICTPRSRHKFSQVFTEVSAADFLAETEAFTPNVLGNESIHLGCSWRPLAAHPGSCGPWRPGGTWRHLAAPGGPRRLLAATGGSRRFQAAPGGSCGPGGAWGLLGWFWPPLAAPGGLKLELMLRVGKLMLTGVETYVTGAETYVFTVCGN
jgi:hypothetical protein